ncbi:MAG: hypothetical protein Q4G65_16410 [bacterium]|nr:hypothetical protein [bacterium]
MKIQSPIKFNTYASRTKLTSKTTYVGKIEHNANLSLDQVVERMAARLRRSPAEVRYFIDALGECVKDELAEGNSMSLGWCRIGLSMTGPLAAANSPFGEQNGLKVTMRAEKPLVEALGQLRPVNDFGDGGPRILSVAQWSADLNSGKGGYVFGPKGEYLLTLDGPRRVLVCALGCNARPDVEDEGVWIESLDGEILLRGTIVESAMDICNFDLDGHLAPGDYRLVIAARGKNPEGGVTRATRVVTAVS